MPPERFVVTTVMATFVHDDADQLVLALVQDAAQRKALGEGNLGRILLRLVGCVINRTGQVDGEHLGKADKAEVPRNAPLGRIQCVRQGDIGQRPFRVGVDGLLEPVNGMLCLLAEGLRTRLGELGLKHLLRMD